MLGTVAPSQLFNSQQLTSKLTYASDSDPAAPASVPPAPPPAPLSLTPWIIGGVALGGVLYLLFRD